MATHPSILAWRIPQTEEPRRLWSMGSCRAVRNSATFTITAKVSQARSPLCSKPSKGTHLSQSKRQRSHSIFSFDTHTSISLLPPLRPPCPSCCFSWESLYTGCSLLWTLLAQVSPDQLPPPSQLPPAQGLPAELHTSPECPASPGPALSTALKPIIQRSLLY